MPMVTSQVRSVTTPFLTWFGLLLLCSSIIGTIALLFNQAFLGAFFVGCLFGSGGAALYLMGGRISHEVEGLRVNRPLSDKLARWDEIAAVSYGGGNLVFALNSGGRIVAPGPEFWVGAEKTSLAAMLDTELAGRGIGAIASVRAIAQVGDR